ncbi:hypothetical protein PybrP1_010779 [[Pythium] brassicae (nom. inval.)]|nr:hypothetical protein PybrP1_010779 [[Pythium] brassicae (nom. inval.)]
MASLVQSISDMVSPKPTALLAVADECEEIEVVGLSEVLARAGVRVTVASVNEDRADHVVTLAKGTMIQADKSIELCTQDEYDAIVVPGGPGAKVLGASATLTDLLRKQKAAGKLYGGLCAGSLDVLYRNKLVSGPMTTYPQLKDELGDLFVDEAVVVSGNCVTSQSPGTAIAMGLKLVELLRGENTAREVAKHLNA